MSDFMSAVPVRPSHGGYPTPAQARSIDGDLLKAIAWCRVGGRTLGWPADDRAYGRAESLGLLRHHPTWHATPQGEGVLIAAGLLAGAPAPEQSTVHVLWASCQRYRRPQFVAAWSDGLADSWPDLYESQRAEAEQFFRDFGDDAGWTFWTTIEDLDAPEVPVVC